MKNLEQRVRDFKSDHNIEVLSQDDIFLDELVNQCNDLYEASTEYEKSEETVRDLTSLLKDINEMTSEYEY